MNSLKEALRQRRAAEMPEGRSCELAGTAARALQVQTWNGEKWVFPWSHFSAACHQGSGESEKLVLSFANHEVVLEGARLALLIPGIAGYHLNSLREMPAKFRAQTDISEPFVGRVSVRLASDSKDGTPQTS